MQSLVKYCVIINALLAFPALFGMTLSFFMSFEEPVAIIPFVSLVIGIHNAIKLYRHRYSKNAWISNLFISLYSIILISVPLMMHDIRLWENNYYALFIWPIIMTATSLYVLQNFYSYEKARR